jgi:succinate dehydrogenase/fumarate reductase-like Fe-S protein
MQTIIVKGLASQKQSIFKWDERDPSFVNMALLDFLCNQSLPIAYSCYGEGVCQKCAVRYNEDVILACQILLKELPDGAIIEISYL